MRAGVAALAVLMLGACHKDAPAVDTAASPAAAPVAVDPQNSCNASQLSATVSGSDAGMGHRTVRVRWRNDGDAACTLTGYPAVTLLDSANNVVTVSVDTVEGAYLTGSHAVTSVTLQSHEVAVFDVGWVVVEGGAGGCRDGKSFRVAPPHSAVASSAALSADIHACGARMTVTPVVALDSLTPGERDR